MIPQSDNTLLERNTGGITVELRYLPIMDMVGVHVRFGDSDAGQWRTATRENALDMFHHPFAYGFRVPDTQAVS